LSAISLIFNGCSRANQINRFFLIDISKSNSSNINSIFYKVNELYQESGPDDLITVYFFSNIEYLAYFGPKLNKDRDFLPILVRHYQKAASIQTGKGTFFDIFKYRAENSSGYIYLFTDGFFEKSTFSSINLLPKSHVFIIGLNITNNEKMLNCFPRGYNDVTIDFQGK
jgi:hypothetical protein